MNKEQRDAINELSGIVGLCKLGDRPGTELDFTQLCGWARQHIKKLDAKVAEISVDGVRLAKLVEKLQQEVKDEQWKAHKAANAQHSAENSEGRLMKELEELRPLKARLAIARHCIGDLTIGLVELRDKDFDDAEED